MVSFVSDRQSNTIIDLITDTIGAIAASLLILKALQEKTNSLPIPDRDLNRTI